MRPINNFTVTKTATILEVYVGRVDIQHSAAGITWLLRDAEGSVVNDGTLVMQGADYDAWGNSDEYVWTWTASQIGVTLK